MMAHQGTYFAGLDALLRVMPPGRIDLVQFEAHERRFGRRYDDPPEIIERWLVDRQRRIRDA
jgi:hypothetical protein